MKDQNRTRLMYLVLAAGGLFITQGCLATRDWVREQVNPVAGRVSENEQRLTQSETQIGNLGGRVSGVEGKVSGLDGRVGQVDAKTEKALNALANLRLQRRLVIDLKEGANFAFNSWKLPAQAQKEIDGFISDLKGDPNGSESMIFLVAGHTDNIGPEDYNYDLGKRRADAVSRYLITQKKMDPLRVVTVSYGKTAPLVDNSTLQNRAKNRRVEILVYQDGVTSASAAQTAPADARGAQRQQPSGERISQAR